MIDAYQERIEKQQRIAAWQAWHIAALPLQKKFPSLSTMLGDEKNVEPQTPEQMLAAMQAWVSATRG